MVIAVVIGGHVAVLALLAIQHGPGSRPLDNERMTLVFLDPLGDSRPPPLPGAPPRTAATRRLAPSTPAAPPESDRSTAIIDPEAAPEVDWYANGADAAQRAAAAPTPHDFGFPKRDPAPRGKKEFGWDKTHTERVHALEGGGIGVHLSDNCELIIAPFPMAGCALGKRKARGDLFDEMKAPVEPGDWKDR